MLCFPLGTTPSALCQRAGSAPILALLALLLALCAAPVEAAAPRLEFDQLTTTELRSALAAGVTTVLVPIGGTEQSGPALALGKHNARARLLALRIAERLGNALVAPLIAYVPEGNIDPPTEHMRFAGTLTVPTATFEEVLRSTAQSLRHHGFRTIVFLGDHGGYQGAMADVATRLDRERGQVGRVIALREYYEAASRGYAAELRKRGFSDAQIGLHAGLADTALTLALEPDMVRSGELENAARGASVGVVGDPRGASAELGMLGVNLIVERSVAAIRAAQEHP